MTDLPIAFRAEMVRALLDGRKTQTRRMLQTQPTGDIRPNASWSPDHGFKKDRRAGHTWSLHSPYLGSSRLLHASVKVRFAVGDRLWVRETYYQLGHWEPVVDKVTRKGRRQKWGFVADSDAITFDPPAAFRKGRNAAFPFTSCWHQRLGRFMPRKFSRTTLIVTGVKIERLQDVSEDDAIAEGITATEFWRDEHPASVCFAVLWNHINGSVSWAANPLVVALTFRVIRANIDAPEARAA